MSKILYNLGDSTPINGSAFLVYDDSTCVAWDRVNFADEDIVVYRFTLSPTVLEDYDWLDIDSFAKESSVSKELLLSYINENTLPSLAEFYRLMSLVYGYEKFSSVEYFSVSDLQKTFAKQIKRIAIVTPTHKEIIDSLGEKVEEPMRNDYYKVFEQDSEVTKEELNNEIEPFQVESWTKNQCGDDYSRFIKYRDEIKINDEVIINKDLCMRFRDPAQKDSYLPSGSKIKIISMPISKNNGVLDRENLTRNDKFPYYYRCKVEHWPLGILLEFSSIQFHIKSLE